VARRSARRCSCGESVLRELGGLEPSRLEPASQSSRPPPHCKGQRLSTSGLPRSRPMRKPTRASNRPQVERLTLAQGGQQVAGRLPARAMALSAEKDGLQGRPTGQQQQHFAPLIALLQQASAIRSDSASMNDPVGGVASHSRKSQRLLSPHAVAVPAASMPSHAPGWCCVRLARAGRLPGQCRRRGSSAEGGRRPAIDRLLSSA